MLKLKTIKIKTIKDFFKRLPMTLGKNAFFSFLGLFILSLMFGIFIFYKHYLSIKEIEIEIETTKQFQFHSETYQEVLEIWQEKEEKFKETDFKQYPNPFLF